jgi:hypothetical protein
MSSTKGHFERTAVVPDEPADVVVGQTVRIVVDAVPAVETPPPPRPSLFGFAKGRFEMSEDFNEQFEDFAEY